MNQRTKKIGLACTVFLAALAAGGGGSFALWKAPGDSPAATITAGDLDIAAGEVTWRETSPDVAAAPHEIDASSYLARQGDTFEVTYAFETRLEGDNMLGGLSMGWPAAGDDGALVLPDGVTGTYRIITVWNSTLALEIVHPTPIGDPPVFDFDEMDASSAGRADVFELIVDLDFAGMSDRFGQDSDVQVADLGAFTIGLDQLRTGGSFK
ncbi:MAG: hypothetical protein IR160_01305 [Salinibacterium sp.]|nr:hypothetical protein [Salinibacterium sp.]MBF0671204.1 hypothetical protein [Salinibacterium sp.]